MVCMTFCMARSGYFCRRKSCSMVCSDTCEPTAKRRFSCFSIRVSISWSSSDVKPSAPGMGCLLLEQGGMYRKIFSLGALDFCEVLIWFTNKLNYQGYIQVYGTEPAICLIPWSPKKKETAPFNC